MSKGSRRGALLFFLAGLLFACAAKAPAPSRTRTDAAIHSAANALRGRLGADGKFTYVVDLRSGEAKNAPYSMIRHAGAVYGLAMYEKNSPSPEGERALKLSTKYLLQNALRPVANGKYKAIYSDGKVELGGTALGLVAALSVAQLYPDEVDMAAPLYMGAFLLFLQTENGDFYTSFDEKMGKNDHLVSLFYPGEAILALTRLYEKTNQKRWLVAAENGLRFLAESRVGAGDDTPLDNWALVATAEILTVDHQLPKDLAALFATHAQQIVRADLRGQIEGPATSNLRGGYNPDGLTTKTATRLEGMLAIYPWLSDEPLRSEVRRSSALAIDFLLRAQLSTGPHRGAWTGAVEDPKAPAAEIQKIRIDYIQHALSALLKYHALGLDL